MYTTPIRAVTIGLIGLTVFAVGCSGPVASGPEPSPSPSANPSPEHETSAPEPEVDLEAIAGLPILYRVTADDLDPWPFTFEQGTLVCHGSVEQPRIVITPIPSPANGGGIAINVEARQDGAVHEPSPSEWALEEPWTGDNPELAPLLEAGLELCEYHDLKSAHGLDTVYGDAAEFADR